MLPLQLVNWQNHINYHNVKEENIDQYTLSRKYKIENKKFDYDKGGYMPK